MKYKTIRVRRCIVEKKRPNALTITNCFFLSYEWSGARMSLSCVKSNFLFFFI